MGKQKIFDNKMKEGQCFTEEKEQASSVTSATLWEWDTNLENLVLCASISRMQPTYVNFAATYCCHCWYTENDPKFFWNYCLNVTLGLYLFFSSIDFWKKNSCNFISFSISFCHCSLIKIYIRRQAYRSHHQVHRLVHIHHVAQFYHSR